MANIIRIGGGGGGSATLITKSITQNGTYNASDDNADGYSSVSVSVSGGSPTFLYSLNQSQGGVWITNTGIDLSQHDTFLFVYSDSGVNYYMRQMAKTDIADADVSPNSYTTVFPSGAIVRDFNVRRKNGYLDVSFGSTGSSSRVVSIYDYSINFNSNS